MNGHHLILGQLKDFITGNTIPDTHDERYRQNIARWLVEEKKHHKKDIEKGRQLILSAGDKRAVVRIDFLVHLEKRIGMIVKYGPGSIVTRRRSALAFSRLVNSRQIPIVIVTNGEEAEILDGVSGKVRSKGFETIPDREEMKRTLSNEALTPIISKDRAEKESRIAFAYEVDGSCPCDNDICRL